MNTRVLLIAIICGLITALLFLAPIALGVAGSSLSTFSALPLFISVLGFGTAAGIISGGVSIIVLTAFFGIVGAVQSSLVVLAPALWIGHLAGLKRDDRGYEEWYPLNAILMHMALISGLATLLYGFFTNYSTETATKVTTELMTQWAAINASGSVNTAAIEVQAKAVAELLPFIMPFSILILLAVNLYLGVRFATARGWMLRPRDDIPASANLPIYAGAIFTIALFISFTGGTLGLIAKVVAGAVGGAFALVGLAVIHYLTRNLSLRSFVLVPLYFVMLVGPPFIGSLLAALGIAEGVFQLRARWASPPPSN